MWSACIITINSPCSSLPSIIINSGKNVKGNQGRSLIMTEEQTLLRAPVMEDSIIIVCCPKTPNQLQMVTQISTECESDRLILSLKLNENTASTTRAFWWLQQRGMIGNFTELYWQQVAKGYTKTTLVSPWYVFVFMVDSFPSSLRGTRWPQLRNNHYSLHLTLYTAPAGKTNIPLWKT